MKEPTEFDLRRKENYSKIVEQFKIKALKNKAKLIAQQKRALELELLHAEAGDTYKQGWNGSAESGSPLNILEKTQEVPRGVEKDPHFIVVND